MDLTSSLTTLPSLSTPGSFRTARGSPANQSNSNSNAASHFNSNSTAAGADDTALSSPADDPVPEKILYRDAVQLPHELRSHCQIHLEEQLYTAAINILSGLLSDTTAADATTTATPFPPTTNPNPIRIPPPSQIALLTTLLIHPSFTTRAPDKNNLHTAAHAHAYLRGLLSTVGPINANFRAAFDFSSAVPSSPTASTPPPTTSYSTHPNARRARSGSTTSSASDAPLGGLFARSQILFHRAPDFWAVLGWAFRCAAEHPHRWRCWRAWLELVVGVLEGDHDARMDRDEAQHTEEEREGGTGKYPCLAGGLVAAYVEGLRRERRNVLREVLRALFSFCDGEMVASDRKFFVEVFDRETVIGVKNKRKRAEVAAQAVDVENDRFGDYLDGEEEDDDDDDDDDDDEAEDDDAMSAPARTKGRGNPGRKSQNAKTTASSSSTTTLALTDDIASTIPLRLRIFRLLSGVTYHVPMPSAPADELYEKFADHVRGLPLATFALFVSTRPAHLPEPVQVSLLREIIDATLTRNHPDPDDVDPGGGGGHDVSPLVLRECFLPFAAGCVTAEDNAKLSLALESLAWLMYAQVDIEYDKSWRRAVETGIKAREDRIKRKGTAKAVDAADQAAREVLARSARNLRAWVDLMEAAGS